MKEIIIDFEKIDKKRKALDVPMDEFSRWLDMHWTAYQKIIQNKSTTIKTLNKIAAALGCKDAKELLK